jgi:hypothetical protein
MHVVRQALTFKCPPVQVIAPSFINSSFPGGALKSKYPTFFCPLWSGWTLMFLTLILVNSSPSLVKKTSSWALVVKWTFFVY